VFDPVVITVGSFHAGTTDNVIPDEARFLATARSFSQESRSALAELVPRLIGDIARGHGLTAEAIYSAKYPVTVKDAAEAAFAAETVAAVFGAGARGQSSRSSGPRTSPLSWSGCPGRSSCWAPARPGPTR